MQTFITHFLFMMTFLTLHAGIINPGNGSVSFDLSAKSWGENKSYQARKSQESTPDGKSCLELAIPPGQPGGVFIIGNNAKIEKESAALIPDWNEVSFQYRSNDCGGKLTILFQTRGADGKTIYSNYAIPLIGKEWKTVTMPRMQYCSSKEGTKLNRLTAVTFLGNRSSVEQKLWIGPITFRQQSNVVLNKLNIAIAPQSEEWDKIPFVSGFDGTDSLKSRVKLRREGNILRIQASQELDTSRMICNAADSNSNVWADDSFQIVLGNRNDGKTWHQFIVNRNNIRQSLHCYFDKVADAFLRGKNRKSIPWDTQIRTEAQRWIIEMKLDLNAIGIHPEELPVAGLQLHFNNPSRSSMRIWTNTKSVIDPSRFGILAMPEKATELSGIRSVRLQIHPTEAVPKLRTTAKGNALLSTPEGKVFPVATRPDEESVFQDYLPCGGIQRLVVYCEKAPVFFCGAYASDPISFVSEKPYWTHLLNPEPRKRQSIPGAFTFQEPLTIRFGGEEVRYPAEMIQNGISGFLQKKALPVMDSALPKYSIVIGTAAPAETPKKPEGYGLNITPEGIRIDAESPAGTLHGARTLEQLMRYVYLANETAVPAQKISDWPELKYRIWNAWSDGYSVRRISPEENYEGQSDILRRYALGSKLNLWMLNNTDAVGFRADVLKPFLAKEWMTPRQMRMTAEFCRKNHSLFIPAIHGPSHAVWITRVRPDMIMPGYGSYDANPLHKDYDKIYYGAVSELLDYAKPPFFQCMNDEWFHLPRGTQSNLLNGIPKNEVFANSVCKSHDFLKQRGVRMVMYSDMLDQTHNGGKPYETAKMLDKLPRDIILCNWGAGVDTIRGFAKAGFENWIVNNRRLSVAEKVLKPYISGAGVLNYSLIAPDTGYGALGMLYSADRAWNFGSEKALSYDDFITERGKNLIANYSVNPNPSASRSLLPLPLKFNSNFPEAKLPDGILRIASVPIAFPPKASVVRAPAEIPVHRKASSLIFLHSEFCRKEDRKTFAAHALLKKAFHGIPVGSYTIVYSDGSRENIRLNNTGNIGMLEPFDMVCSKKECLYPLQTRGTIPLADGKFLYLWEWVNPFPEKEIREIQFRSEKTPAEPLLFALTLREVKQQKNP